MSLLLAVFLEAISSCTWLSKFIEDWCLLIKFLYFPVGFPAQLRAFAMHLLPFSFSNKTIWWAFHFEILACSFNVNELDNGDDGVVSFEIHSTELEFNASGSSSLSSLFKGTYFKCIIRKTVTMWTGFISNLYTWVNKFDLALCFYWLYFTYTGFNKFGSMTQK